MKEVLQEVSLLFFWPLYAPILFLYWISLYFRKNARNAEIETALLCLICYPIVSIAISIKRIIDEIKS